jgi:hypothetical protein
MMAMAHLPLLRSKMMSGNLHEGQTTGHVRMLLQLEGLMIGIAAILAFWLTGGSWWLFAVLILAPDLGMAGYAVSKAAGTWSYNALHTYTLPLLLGLAGLFVQSDITAAVALIWVAHIGLDRAIGYGLKYPSAFKHTHLKSA